MNRLFSKSEIYALKDIIKENIQDLNNLYNAVLGIEQNMNKSTQEKTLK